GAGAPGAGLVAHGPLRAGEELVPGADGGAARLDDELERLGLGHEAAHGVSAQLRGEAAVVRDPEALLAGQRRVAQGGARIRRDLAGNAVEELGAHGEDEPGVVARAELDRGLVQPGPPVVAVGPHAVAVPSGGRGAQLGAPAVGSRADEVHGVHALDACRVGEQQLGTEQPVPFPEDGGLEGDHLAEVALGGPAVLRLARRQVADGDATDPRRPPPRPGGGVFRGHVSTVSRRPPDAHGSSRRAPCGWPAASPLVTQLGALATNCTPRGGSSPAATLSLMSRKGLVRSGIACRMGALSWPPHGGEGVPFCPHYGGLYGGVPGDRSTYPRSARRATRTSMTRVPSTRHRRAHRTRKACEK